MPAENLDYFNRPLKVGRRLIYDKKISLECKALLIWMSLRMRDEEEPLRIKWDSHPGYFEVSYIKSQNFITSKNIEDILNEALNAGYIDIIEGNILFFEDLDCE